MTRTVLQKDDGRYLILYDFPANERTTADDERELSQIETAVPPEPPSRSLQVR